jgi:hypothetical protein
VLALSVCSHELWLGDWRPEPSKARAFSRHGYGYAPSGLLLVVLVVVVVLIATNRL